MSGHFRLGFHNLDKDAFILEVDAIGAVHEEAPDAARPQVELVKSVREALRPPPMRRVIRIGPRFEHELMGASKTRVVTIPLGSDPSSAEARVRCSAMVPVWSVTYPSGCSWTGEEK